MSDFMRWARHGIKRGRYEMGPRMALASAIAVVTLTLLGALYLTLVSHTAARGRRIERLREDLYLLRRENEQLEVDIGREGAVSGLRERAVMLKYVPADEVEYLSVPEMDP
jgi:hypothetical protein